MCFVIGVWRGTRDLTRRAGALARRTRVYRARAAQPVLQPHAAVRSGRVLHAEGRSAHRKRRRARDDERDRACSACSRCLRRRAHRLSRLGGVITILLVAGLGPFLLRELARGVHIPQHGVDAALWLIWEIPLFLAAVSVLLAGAAAGATTLGARRGLSPWVAPGVATVAAVLAPIVWMAPGRFPWWYTLLWVAAIAMLALSRRTRFVIVSASARRGARRHDARLGGARRADALPPPNADIAGLSQTDSVGVALLRRFGAQLRADVAPATREDLLKQFVTSDVAAAGYPDRALRVANRQRRRLRGFQTADIPIPVDAIGRIVAEARATQRDDSRSGVRPIAAVELVMAAPSASGGVTAVVVAPKSRLFEIDPFARLLGLDVDTDAEPPYTVRLRETHCRRNRRERSTWRRRGERVARRLAWRAREPARRRRTSKSSFVGRTTLVQRGALIVLLDLAIVGVLWLASVVADGGAGRWLRARRRTWGRSYRARLSLALFAFFVMPALAFAVWSYQQLATDASAIARAARRRDAARVDAAAGAPLWLPAESESARHAAHALRGRRAARDERSALQRPRAHRTVSVARSRAQSRRSAMRKRSTQLEQVDGSAALFGYRAFNDPLNRRRP